MAKKPSFSNPIIPKKPSFCEVARIKRAGKRDARKNQGIKDFTRTQAINEFESFSQRGEIALNDWLLRVSSPYITGNARIEAEVRLFETKIAKQKANMGKTGREQKAAELRLAALEQEMADLYSQYASNKETGFALIRLSLIFLQTLMTTYSSLLVLKQLKQIRLLMHTMNSSSLKRVTNRCHTKMVSMKFLLCRNNAMLNAKVELLFQFA